MKRGRAAIRAALEVGPETRIEQVARAIAGCTFGPGTVDKAFTGEGLELVRDQAMKQARAAVSALCENPAPVRSLVEDADAAYDRGFRAGLAEARAAIEKQIDRVDNRPRHGAPSALDRAVERVVTGSLRAALASLDEGGTSE